MKVRVYTDYDPIRILRGVNKNQFTEPTDSLAQKMGLVGAHQEIEDADIPSDRTNRDCWAFDGGKIKEDAAKVAEKIAKATEKAAKKNAVLSKLKITEAEFKELVGG